MSEFDEELNALASRVFFSVVIAHPRPNFFNAASISSGDDVYFNISDVGVLVISEIPDRPEKLFELVDVILSLSTSVETDVLVFCDSLCRKGVSVSIVALRA